MKQCAHREHPLDTVSTVGPINLPRLLLGFPLGTLAGLVAFRGLLTIFILSNVRLPLGPLRVLLGSPTAHHWHHAKDRDAGNDANVSPLIDVISRTYHGPAMEPAELGLREAFPKSHLGRLIRPLLPRGWHRRTPALTTAPAPTTARADAPAPATVAAAR